MIVNVRIRRDTSANWTAANPILKNAEPGLETDTKKFKIGDGTTRWNDDTNYYSLSGTTGVSNLSDLADVSVAPIKQDVLLFQNGKWENANLPPIISRKIKSNSRRFTVAPEELNPAWVGGYWRAARAEFTTPSGGTIVTGTGTIGRMEDAISGVSITQSNLANRPAKTTWRGLPAVQFEDGKFLSNPGFNQWIDRTVS